jgi:hypothetical protein
MFSYSYLYTHTYRPTHRHTVLFKAKQVRKTSKLLNYYWYFNKVWKRIWFSWFSGEIHFKIAVSYICHGDQLGSAFINFELIKLKNGFTQLLAAYSFFLRSLPHFSSTEAIERQYDKSTRPYHSNVFKRNKSRQTLFLHT